MTIGWNAMPIVDISGRMVPFLLTADVAELMDHIRLNLKVLALHYRP